MVLAEPLAAELQLSEHAHEALQSLGGRGLHRKTPVFLNVRDEIALPALRRRRSRRRVRVANPARCDRDRLCNSYQLLHARPPASDCRRYDRAFRSAEIRETGEAAIRLLRQTAALLQIVGTRLFRPLRSRSRGSLQPDRIRAAKSREGWPRREAGRLPLSLRKTNVHLSTDGARGL